MAMDAAVASLGRRGLLPPPWKGGAAGLDARDRVDYRDRYRGALLGVAIGDALGRPAESRPPAQIRAAYGVLRDYVPWPGWAGGPIGTITDDTQMTMCVAGSYLRHRRLDPVDLAARFEGWLDYGRGKGRTCTRACLNLRSGMPWWEAGVESAGNGAAMRAAPVGLAHPRSPEGIRSDGAVSAVITHADPMAVVSAVAVGYVVAYLLHRSPSTIDFDDLMGGLAAVTGDLNDPGAPERKPGGRVPVSLADRLAEVPGLLGVEPERAFGYLRNGAYVLESLPAALWCFLEEAGDPEQAVVLAANGGYDADTVASMAGAFSGALHGESAWPRRWLDDLEYADELRALADGLLEIGDPEAVSQGR